MSFKYFSQFSDSVSHYFTDLRTDLKKARIKLSVQEYLSIGIMTCFIIFVLVFPVLSMVFGFIFADPILAFVSSFSVSLGIILISVWIILNYPKIVTREKGKHIDNALPFAALYLSTVASSKLPLHKTFQIFSKFEYGELTDEIRSIVNDVDIFGLDINTALERAVDRSPSKSLKEMLWGILSTVRSGGDLSVYLKEVAKNSITEYRRQLYEFSHQLTIYIEIYLTSMVLGAIFFTILTTIISSIGGPTMPTSVITLQFLIIFIFMPMVSLLFIMLVRSSTPGGEG